MGTVRMKTLVSTTGLPVEELDERDRRVRDEQIPTASR